MSRWLRNRFGAINNCFWIPASLAKILLFLWKIQSKTVLFHWIRRETRLAVFWTAWFVPEFHESLITVAKSRWDNHIAWNRKGIQSLLTEWLESKRSMMGQWSELILGKWERWASGNIRCQAILLRPLSIRFQIIPSAFLLLHQVNLEPEKPRSISWVWPIQSIKVEPPESNL